MRVFAERGYHATRVSDIAAEAGVAHGLVYHYFASKEDLLREVFRRSWSHLVVGLEDIRQGPGSATDRLARVVRLMLGSYRMAPELVRVLVLEVTRSANLRHEVEEIRTGFATIEALIRDGQEAGELRRDVSPELASYITWGAIDEVITAWVLGTLPTTDEEMSAAERAIVAVVGAGLAEPAART